MATLTSDQKAYLRAKSGDNCIPPLVSDPLLQIYYDANDSDLNCTIASILEDRWAAVRAGASKLTDLGTSVDTSEMDHIKELMDYWGGRCGTGGASLSVGMLNLDIDSDWANIDAQLQHELDEWLLGGG